MKLTLLPPRVACVAFLALGMNVGAAPVAVDSSIPAYASGQRHFRQPQFHWFRHPEQPHDLLG